jgi:hypothetical protein
MEGGREGVVIESSCGPLGHLENAPDFDDLGGCPRPLRTSRMLRALRSISSVVIHDRSSSCELRMQRSYRLPVRVVSSFSAAAPGVNVTHGLHGAAAMSSSAPQIPAIELSAVLVVPIRLGQLGTYAGFGGSSWDLV